jgi:hypothetical protein
MVEHVERMEDQRTQKSFQNTIQKVKEIQEGHRIDGKVNL